ncbi:hypothetical protein [Embleya sp. NPDC020630]|uniref:hypothetical protein n=1 Tax=Embleya sp. NPDC020630 TaxID=3363979 RepID=UPI0037B7462B
MTKAAVTPGAGTGGAVSRRGRAGRLATGLAATGAARTAYAALTRHAPGGAALWERRNHRGEALTLLEGPAAAIGATVAAACAPGVPGRWRAAGALAAVAGAGFGTYDDLAGSTDRRGFKGHLGALAKGEMTSGGVKIVGLGAAGLAAGVLVQRHPVDRVLAAVVVAGTANLINLFDLRPGRAAKAVLIAGAPGLVRGGAAAALAAAPVGAAAALLPEDLGEQAMLGDAGANALGAALGVALAAGASRTGLLTKAAVLVGLTAASERVSFTKVIAANRALNTLDMLGRRPAPAASAGPGLGLAKDAGSVAAPDAHAQAGAGSPTEAGADTGSRSDVGADTGSGSATETVLGSAAGAGSGSATGAGADAYADAGSRSDAGSASATEAGAGSGSATEAGAGSVTEAGSGAATEAGADAHADAGLGSATQASVPGSVAGTGSASTMGAGAGAEVDPDAGSGSASGSAAGAGSVPATDAGAGAEPSADTEAGAEPGLAAESGAGAGSGSTTDAGAAGDDRVVPGRSSVEGSVASA